jgi:hypothetical protein
VCLHPQLRRKSKGQCLGVMFVANLGCSLSISNAWNSIWMFHPTVASLHLCCTLSPNIRSCCVFLFWTVIGNQSSLS